jgi:hypothetical protein
VLQRDVSIEDLEREEWDRFLDAPLLNESRWE